MLTSGSLWTREDRAQLVSLVRGGASVDEATGALNRSMESVLNQVDELTYMHGFLSREERLAFLNGRTQTPPLRQAGAAHDSAFERALARYAKLVAAGSDPTAAANDVQRETGLRPAGEAAARVLSGLEARK